MLNPSVRREERRWRWREKREEREEGGGEEREDSVSKFGILG